MLRNLTILFLVLFSISVFANVKTYLNKLMITQGLNNLCFGNLPCKMTLNMCKAKDPDAFTIHYANQSPSKNVSLKFTLVKLKIYYNGNPMGLSDVMTDENQQFAIKDYQDKHLLSFDILAVDGEQNQKVHCHDVSSPNQKHEVLISCSS